MRVFEVGDELPQVDAVVDAGQGARLRAAKKASRAPRRPRAGAGRRGRSTGRFPPAARSHPRPAGRSASSGGRGDRRAAPSRSTSSSASVGGCAGVRGSPGQGGSTRSNASRRRPPRRGAVAAAPAERRSTAAGIVICLSNSRWPGSDARIGRPVWSAYTPTIDHRIIPVNPNLYGRKQRFVSSQSKCPRSSELNVVFLSGSATDRF